MKKIALSLLTCLFVTAAAAQFNLPIQHVIVVVQENRTVNNLFANDPNLSGVTFFSVGACGVGSSASVSQPLEQAITLTPYQLDACFDPSHEHTAWETSYDSGALDGFCQITSGISNCTALQKEGIPSCIVNGETIPCPQYTTVDASQIGTYFQIAANGGFANYMFQTNQGPSFPAHQFLFTGTSAPITPTTEFYNWFAAQNATFGDSTTSMAVSPIRRRPCSK